MPRLERANARGVTFLTDPDTFGEVAFGFTERTGGVSAGPYDSLNLGDACGDDADLVKANRLRVLEAIGCGGYEKHLINPVQVHGSRVLTIAVDATDAEVSAVQAQAREGADAVVCARAGVPVLLCYADCTPVVLVGPKAFAVVHSGWRGTIAHIVPAALRELVRAAGCLPEAVTAYVGPCAGGADYEVSPELYATFLSTFGRGGVCGARNVDLAASVAIDLVRAGMREERVCLSGISTVTSTDRFFSWRASGGSCGRHGAIAVLVEDGRRGA